MNATNHKDQIQSFALMPMGKGLWHLGGQAWQEEELRKISGYSFFFQNCGKIDHLNFLRRISRYMIHIYHTYANNKLILLIAFYSSERPTIIVID